MADDPNVAKSITNEHRVADVNHGTWAGFRSCSLGPCEPCKAACCRVGLDPDPPAVFLPQRSRRSRWDDPIPIRSFDPGRLCTTCGTPLSRYNAENRCSLHALPLIEAV